MGVRHGFRSPVPTTQVWAQGGPCSILGFNYKTYFFTGPRQVSLRNFGFPIFAQCGATFQLLNAILHIIIRVCMTVQLNKNALAKVTPMTSYLDVRVCV